jgi:hypothetical protein
MHSVEIAEQIFEQGLRTEQTATPAATVAATIASSFRNDGEHSPFIRVGRGVYALRGIQKDAPVIAQKELAPTEASEVTGLVNAFGMFWDRAKVNWETDPRILGQQQAGAKPVNFCEQRGVFRRWEASQPFTHIVAHPGHQPPTYPLGRAVHLRVVLVFWVR